MVMLIHLINSCIRKEIISNNRPIGKNEDASEMKYDGSKSFKETLRRLGYVKEKSLIYNNRKAGK